MASYVMCITDDLKDDADLYAPQARADIVTTDTSLERIIGASDTLIIYGHGQYSDVNGVFKATNKIIWGDKALDGVQVCEKLLKMDLPTGVSNITIIVHCCFTAGTRESPPTEAQNQHTFAGQLCSALKAYYFPGLRVIGYQGATKAGKSGFAANASDNAPRLSRSQADPNKGELWQMTYGGEGDREVLLAKGASAKWS